MPGVVVPGAPVAVPSPLREAGSVASGLPKEVRLVVVTQAPLDTVLVPELTAVSNLQSPPLTSQPFGPLRVCPPELSSLLLDCNGLQLGLPGAARQLEADSPSPPGSTD